MLGTLYYSNDDKYEGGFLNYKLHGKGSYYSKSGDRFESEWENGKLKKNWGIL